MLRTLTEDGRGQEWRVKELQAIENLWWDERGRGFSMGDEDIVIENAREMFADSLVFQSQEEAMAAAADLSRENMKDFGALEYGINAINVNRVF